MDLTSYLLGKNASSGGGGGDLSEYFNSTEITSNTTNSNYIKTLNIVKTTPSFTVSSDVTSLSYCFQSWGLKSINVSEMDTSNITNMRYMFNTLQYVEELDLSNFDTSKVTNYDYMFNSSMALKKIDASSFVVKDNATIYGNSMFYYTLKLAIIDISKFEFSKLAAYSQMFSICGTNCLQSDGAYADGIPFIYVKDETEQNWVLTANNGHPSSWSTANVVIKQ